MNMGFIKDAAGHHGFQSCYGVIAMIRYGVPMGVVIACPISTGPEQKGVVADGAALRLWQAVQVVVHRFAADAHVARDLRFRFALLDASHQHGGLLWAKLR